MVSPAASVCGFTRSRALRSRFRVIAYDLRGHGLTDAPAIATEYSAALLARDLVGVLDVLKIERAAIVGFSLGGGPALALAASKPERVSGLVLADVGAGADDPLKTEWMARRWLKLIGQDEIDELVCDMLRSELFKIYAKRNVRRRNHMAALIRATPIDGLRFTLVGDSGEAEIVVPAGRPSQNRAGADPRRCRTIRLRVQQSGAVAGANYPQRVTEGHRK